MRWLLHGAVVAAAFGLAASTAGGLPEEAMMLRRPADQPDTLPPLLLASWALLGECAFLRLGRLHPPVARLAPTSKPVWDTVAEDSRFGFLEWAFRAGRRGSGPATAGQRKT
jgi:hypothetical protein